VDVSVAPQFEQNLPDACTPQEGHAVVVEDDEEEGEVIV
jgi:hypothetical protein